MGEPDLDPAEDIAVELVLVEDARRMVARGEIVHAPMVGALFLWELEDETGSSREAPGVAAAEGAPEAAAASLGGRITAHLRSHFTATVATFGPEPVETEPAGGEDASAPGAKGVSAALGETGGRDDALGSPHAATVFYALDRRGRLVFLSKGDSRHGRHIGAGAPVAVTVAREYTDWREIQGVQLWGRAEPLRGVARARALATYLARFPFVSGLLEDPRLAGRLRGLEVYRITPRRAALTDNRVGPFGREVLDL